MKRIELELDRGEVGVADDQALGILGPWDTSDHLRFGCGECTSLALVKAPQPHTIVLLDENVEPIDFDGLRSFGITGITGITGMIVQRRRIRQILGALRDHPGLLLAGGPYVSVDQAFFDGLCDVVFVGEADASPGRVFWRRWRAVSRTGLSSNSPSAPT